MSGDDYRPPWRLLYAGLAFGIAVNIAIAAFNVSVGQPYLLPANVAPVAICSAAWWLIRKRQKGRL